MNETLPEKQKSSNIHSIRRLPESWIERIFQRLHGRFGNSFFSKFATGEKDQSGVDLGVLNAKKIWSEELAGYTSEEISRGLKTRFDFPPDCDKFMIACRPSLDYERSFVVAVEQMRKRQDGDDKWDNPAIYWAAVRLGNDINNYPYQSIKTRWAEAVDAAVQDIRSGKLPNEVPVKLIELPAPGKISISKEEAAKRLADVHRILDKKIIKG